jgi:hypothetical protein
MSVSVEGLRSAADFMRLQTGEDPKWLRNAADEIEQLRDALQQLVDWAKDGCPEDGYGYCMTEAQAALKGLSIASVTKVGKSE